LQPAGSSRCGKKRPAALKREVFTPSPRHVRAKGARAVGELLPAVAKPAFERYGFALAEILQHWATYAGKELAAYTAPEKMKWPRSAGGNTGEGATLILRVDGPRAVEVQHRIPQLMERLNAAFGYRAVTAIRILQAPLSVPQPREKVRPPLKINEAAFSGVEDGRLRMALSRMSAGVQAKR
jgi:hypothetical protein